MFAGISHSLVIGRQERDIHRTVVIIIEIGFIIPNDPHIDILCREWAWDEPTNILTGIWEDYSAFSIQLVDKTQYGYDPAIENIRFTIIPEPASLLLLGLGVLALRRQFRP